MGKAHLCATLTVHYTDGSTDTLTADAWSQYYKELPKDQNTDLRQTDGIPVFQFNSFEGSFLQEVNAAAAQMSDAAISMLDLRSNVGGYGEDHFISGSPDTAASVYRAMESAMTLLIRYP